MSKTLIEYVQDILSSMDSDEVNSISDTTESNSVATIVKNIYEDLLTEIELPTQYTIFQLGSSGDITKPNQMILPNTIENIDWIKYNKVTTTDVDQQFRLITFLPKDEYLRIVNSYSSSDSNTITSNFTVDSVEFPLLCLNDRHPEYYTTFDNRTLVFNAYNSAEEATLQSSKTLCYGKRASVFELVDDFIPFTEQKFQSLLFNAAKATAWAELKQTTNNKAEKAEKRARIKTQSAKNSVEHGKPFYDYIAGYGRRK